jgi:D-glycero-beta-D-manno-heptose 1-phosphate adenylyltransferase
MKNLWKTESQKKIVSPDKVEALARKLREEGKRIATLNGSFDLLHAGHLQILFEASQVADVLIVGLNSDDSIKRYKSPERPIIPLEYRLEIMAALAFVDFVTWFEETDPRELLKKIRPDIHVNGSEYGEDCIEACVVHKGGGKIHLVPRIPSLSTSEIIERIRRCDP